MSTQTTEGTHQPREEPTGLPQEVWAAFMDAVAKDEELAASRYRMVLFGYLAGMQKGMGPAGDATLWLASIVHAAGGEVRVRRGDVLKNWTVERIDDHMTGDYVWRVRSVNLRSSGRGGEKVAEEAQTNATKSGVTGETKG